VAVWLLVSYEELDEDLKVIKGEVLAHSPNKEKTYRDLFTLKGRKASAEYAGEFPEDRDFSIAAHNLTT
jgi:hypothetical protein